MRHRIGLRKLNRPTGARLALIRGLMTELIRHEHLQTTAPKAAEPEAATAAAPAETPTASV